MKKIEKSLKSVLTNENTHVNIQSEQDKSTEMEDKEGKEMKTLVQDFSYRGEHFTIVDDGKFIMTVNHKFIGEDGRLTKQLTFWDGLHPSDSVAEAIQSTKEDLDIKYYTAHGMTKAEAFSKVMNVPMEIAEMIYKEVK